MTTILITPSRIFEAHPSILAIKEQMKKYNETFTFQNVSTDKVASIVKLNTKKASKSVR